jgi:hypothetical protein
MRPDATIAATWFPVERGLNLAQVPDAHTQKVRLDSGLLYILKF